MIERRARLGVDRSALPSLSAPQIAQILAPLLIAVPVAVSIATTLARALTTAHPDLGFAVAVNSDAEALFLGKTIYQDPADGYTNQFYTPLFAVLVSFLHHIVLWAGWPILLTFAAALSLAALAARVAYAGDGATRWERLLDVVGAAAVGLLAWWLVSALPVNLLFEGRPDQVAWAFAIFGLFLLARGARGSPRVLVGSAVLLSAAFWTKQTTVIASVAGVVWLFAAAALGATSRRTALAFCLGLAGANLALIGVLNLLTDGWQWWFDIELAFEHPRVESYWPKAREFLYLAGPALALPAVLAAGLAWRAAARRQLSRPTLGGLGDVLRRSPDGRLASLLLLFAAIAIPLSIYSRLKVGAEPNHYIGIVWAAGLLTAIAYRRSRAHTATILVAVAAILVLFVAAQRPGDPVRGYWVAPLHRTFDYAEMPGPLLDYARSHLVYHQTHSDLNVEPQGSIYPNFYNFVDLLAAGKQPMYVVDALLRRRFDAVAPIAFGSPAADQYWETYSSGDGKQEANYVWKLNQVIRAGYGPDAGVPEGFLGRRPGPNRAPWMRSCFGPFDAAGTRFGIRAGGGFWCLQGDGILTLRATPAPTSEIHALDDVTEVGGSMGLLLPRGAGSFAIELRGEGGRRWEIAGRAAPGGALLLEARVDGRRVTSATVRRPRAGALRVVLDFRRSESGGAPMAATGGDVLVALPSIGPGDLSITASRGSGLRLDLSRAQLRTG